MNFKGLSCKFKDESGHFKKTDFKKASVSLQRLLRQHLRSHEVWVELDKDRKTTIARSLYNTLRRKGQENGN